VETAGSEGASSPQFTTALAAEYDTATLEGLRSAALFVLLLVAAIIPIDLWRLPPALARPAAVHDLLVVAAAAALFRVIDRRRLAPRFAAPAGVAFFLLVLSDALRDRAVEAGVHALVAAVILIAIGSFVLRRGWMLSGGLLVCAGWTWTQWSALGAARTAHLGFTLVAGAAVAWPMLYARRRTHRRIVALRREDEARKSQLERALASAEEARRTLDEKVAARTEELSRTTAELRAELAERQRAASERLALEARLQHDALHDALTGLPNRALFLDRLSHAWNRARREPGFRFAVLYLDLDRFKVINDTFGHEIGDQLLVGIGRRLPGCLRPTDTVARLGGDEFAVLLEGFKNAAETSAIADRIQVSLRTPFSIGPHELYVTGSIGIADGVTEGQKPEQYVRDADVAMYAAKARGTPYERFDGAMHSPALARMRMETELRSAIEREQFFLVYQPIVDLRTTRIEGFEALVRWQHPARGVVGPDEFIGLAEETRLIVPLSLWTLRQGCKVAVNWRKRWKTSGPILGINLAAQLLTRAGMAGEILQVLSETGLAPADLAVEITETALMASPQVASSMLGELRAKGVQVFVDDFGTGYSSLAYLSNLPVDRLKIDRTFVNAMTDPNRLRIVRTIATLAHDLGKGIVAEGVETPEQLDRLRSMGCEFGQGWLFSRPMDAAQAEALLEANAQGGAFPGLVEEPAQEAQAAADRLLEDPQRIAPLPGQ
jgi:diguanylate cyclase (GGDEF)-like protein